MSDTIPTPVDLLRLAYGASDELDVWLDEHLPPADLGPVTPDTPWGSLCRDEHGMEVTFVAPHPLIGECFVAINAWGICLRGYPDWQVIRSGPEWHPAVTVDSPEPEARPGPLGTNVGDPITPDTPIGTWAKMARRDYMAHRDYMAQVSKHGIGDDTGRRWWTTEGRWSGYGAPLYTVADPAEVEQWQEAQR